MRALPRTLIGATGGLAALVVVASTAVAHGSGGIHDMPGAGGAIGPGMGEVGEGIMDLMGHWMGGQEPGEHPGTGGGAPMRPQMPAMPDMPRQGMAPGTDSPRMPQMPAIPGQGGMPETTVPGFQLQVAPGWWR